MKLVGDAFAKYKQHTPCIGISTWGVIHGRTALLGGTDEHAGSRSDDLGSPENPCKYSAKRGSACRGVKGVSDPLGGLAPIPSGIAKQLFLRELLYKLCVDPPSHSTPADPRW